MADAGKCVVLSADDDVRVARTNACCEARLLPVACALDLESVLLAAAGRAAGVLVAEPSGRRTLALPVVPGEELFRVWVFTARAVDPVTRIPAIDRAKADRVLMP